MGTRYIHMDVYNATMYSCRNLNTVVKLLLHWKIQDSHIALKAVKITTYLCNHYKGLILLLFGSEPERLFSHYFPFL